MAEQAQNKIAKLWAAIEKAGSINAHVRSQLKEKGFLVERRNTDDMSKRALNK